MRAFLLIICSGVLASTSGCVRSHRAPTAVYVTPAPTVITTPTVLAPTSDKAVVRVYPSSPAVVTPPTAPPAGISATDVVIADSLSELLKSNTSLADASTKVEATVDGGVVTLRGSVPTNHDRDEIVLRISKIPGVTRVIDQLGVDLR